ncbi:MAG: hypothetical protein RBT63_07450 [Bdellovibrionales bacterium]|nr:hypothetical protein [Bdellovibrionales bacterium]
MLITAALVGLIAIGLSSLLINQIKAIQNIELVTTIESDFATMTKLARTPSQIARRLGLKIQNSSGDWVDNPIHNDLHRCLSGLGSGCDKAFGTWTPLPDPEMFFNTKTSRNGLCPAHGPCEYERSTLYRGECTQTRCHALLVSIKISPESSHLKERSAEVRLVSHNLLNRRDIDFSCAGVSGYVVSIDFELLRATCSATGGAWPGPPILMASRLYPHQVPANDCGTEPECRPSVMTEHSCPDGFLSVSIFSRNCI